MASRVDWEFVEDQVGSEGLGNLAHLDQDKMADIFSTTFCKLIFFVEIDLFYFKFHWNLFQGYT